MAKVTYRLRNKGTAKEPIYDKVAPIYVRYGNIVVNTRYDVDKKYWSFKTKWLKPSFVPREPSKAEIIKDYKPLSDIVLSEIRALIYRMDDEMPRSVKRDSKWLKSVISEYHGSAIIEHGEKVFTDYLKQHLKKKRKKDDDPILRVWKEFDDGRNLMPKDLTGDVIGSFIDEYKKKFLVSTLTIYIRNFKQALMLCAVEGVQIPRIGDWNLSTQLEKEKKKQEFDTITLTQEEIDKLFKLKIKSKGQDNVRALFVAMYTTGQRWSDFTANLELFKTCKEDYLKIRQIKTNTNVNVPLTRLFREVVNQVDMKVVSNAYFDKTIKLVCKKAGIDTPTMGRVRKGKKTLVGDKKATEYSDPIQTLPKYEWVESHTARRSTATIFESILGRTETMKITGHKLESTFKDYINIDTVNHIDILKEKGFI